MSKEIIQECINLCDRGWHANARYIYDDIEQKLAALVQTDALENCRRLCKAGQETISPRFAYPHIRERLEEILKGQ